MIVIEVRIGRWLIIRFGLPLLIERSRPRRQSVALWWRGAARHRGGHDSQRVVTRPGTAAEARAWSKAAAGLPRPKLAAVPRTTATRTARVLCHGSLVVASRGDTAHGSPRPSVGHDQAAHWRG